ncbi:MAG: LysM peptidoglycan-binding domain-containing protein [Sphingobacteriales bacterium]|jgi:LysM repeat protein|nr:LysM peptidoglycan-binding domain-containing protein [Sphingobacteriales bacterium]MBP9141053.1 LysM peptidoglycan-binding domain-containing protein [Chitinophagales bacterium]MBK6890916.1 LysM peptidoglycan-binding domain-containing protein [Sphingobacteriales bacterium]MBK7526033.1 LysM peptidoglycan-binding domain-containing protein [Sphingobacteriales bacterium]MBL0247374.1 LysM peptidoglycan-binding domain-containing protein [Sphingobacteriales bacterium]
MKLLLLSFMAFWQSFDNSFLELLTSRDEQARAYIATYNELAVLQMHEAGIPASITLAQGMYESGFGNSELALKANNHFGVKCKSDWKGEVVYKDDDAPNECFRKYATVLDSYRDRSLFLRSGQKYAALFELPITDYKAWANGLKMAGYATAVNYPEKLIMIIERYNLNQYDLIPEYAAIPTYESIQATNSQSSLVNKPAAATTAEGKEANAPQGSIKPQQHRAVAASGIPITDLKSIDEAISQAMIKKQNQIKSSNKGVYKPVSFSNHNQSINRNSVDVPSFIYSGKPENNTMSALIGKISWPPDEATVYSQTINNSNNNKYHQEQANATTSGKIHSKPTANFSAMAAGSKYKANTLTSPLATNSAQKLTVKQKTIINNLHCISYYQSTTAAQIAATYNIPLAEICRFNEINTPDLLLPSNTIWFLEPKKNKAARNHKKHTVRQAETLWQIAQQYGMGINQLALLNKLNPTDQPLPGQTLQLRKSAKKAPLITANISLPANNNKSANLTQPLPTENTTTPTTTNNPNPTESEVNHLINANIYHTVQPNETLNEIGKKYGVTPQQIRALNKLGNSPISNGQQLLIKSIK